MKENIEIWAPFEDGQGKGKSERHIEVPWLAQKIRDRAYVSSVWNKVLDVGCGESAYLDMLCTYFDSTFCIDLLPLSEWHKGFDDHHPWEKTIDLSGTIIPESDLYHSFPSNFFDAIIFVSTIEHFNYGDWRVPTELSNIKKKYDDWDVKALIECSRILPPFGEVFITVPYGEYKDMDWSVIYDEETMKNLFEIAGFEISEEEYFVYRDDGWYICRKEDLVDVPYFGNGAVNAAGVGCFILKKG